MTTDSSEDNALVDNAVDGDEWTAKDWDTLIYAIHQKKCILMLGPDSSLDNGRSLSEILASEIAEDLDPNTQALNIDKTNLAQVSQFFLFKEDEDEMSLEHRVHSFYEKYRDKDSPLHRKLSKLPFYFAVTVTPDRMFYNALKKEDEHGKSKDPITHFYNFRGKNPRIVDMGTEEKPLIFNLYGTLSEPDSLVITENHLLQFIVSIAGDNPKMPINILDELSDKRKSLLFLGFGFKQWYLKVLIYVLQKSEKGPHSVALEKFPGNVMDFNNTVLFFKKSRHHIHIYNYPLEEFVDEMVRRYEKEYGRENEGQEDSGSVASSPVQQSPAKPKIFICHLSEDKDAARHVHDKLKNAGFEPWLDVKSLFVGEDWEDEIKEAIGKKCDYFLVLQSEALSRSDESYVFVEIDEALKRQKRKPKREVFILPTKVSDTSPLLPELSHLHSQPISLQTDEGITELITTIKRHEKKREETNHDG